MIYDKILEEVKAQEFDINEEPDEELSEEEDPERQEDEEEDWGEDFV